MVAFYFLSLLVIAGLWIQGFHISIQRGMILGFVSEWHAILSEAHINTVRRLKNEGDGEFSIKITKFFRWLSKPFYRCTICMSSVHGSLVFIIGNGLFGNPLPILSLPLFVVSLAGLMTLVMEYLYPSNDGILHEVVEVDHEPIEIQHFMPHAHDMVEHYDAGFVFRVFPEITSDKWNTNLMFFSAIRAGHADADDVQIIDIPANRVGNTISIDFDSFTKLKEQWDIHSTTSHIEENS